MIRALVYPFPGAFTHFNGLKTIIWWGVPVTVGPANARPGQLYRFEHSDQWAIAAGDGGILLEEIEIEGGGKGEPGPLFERAGIEVGAIAWSEPVEAEKTDSGT